jgi:hypothetical protein
MRADDYLRALPDRVRLKVAAAQDLEAALELDLEMLEELGLSEALRRAYESWSRRAGAIKRFGRDVPSAVPEPAVVELPKESVRMLAERLSRHGLDLFSDSLVVLVGGRKYALAVELECG